MAWKSTIPVIVTDIVQETPTVKRFTLRSVNGEVLPAFSGGAHIITYLPVKPGTVLERAYSLAGDPANREAYEIAVRLVQKSEGGSRFWHERVRVGEVVKISYPKNHFPLSLRARHHVFYAGGIGITPFMAMMADLASKGESFELHYAARSKEECPFFEDIRKRYTQKTWFYFSRDKNPQRISPSTLQRHPIGTHIYICGPATMVTEFTHTARVFGYPEQTIHVELFAPLQAGPMRPFRAILKRSGRVVNVSESKSLLDALLDEGIPVRYSCRSGGCGNCQIEVLEGEIDHRGTFLTKEEKEEGRVMLACVSRAHSDALVLNL